MESGLYEFDLQLSRSIHELSLKVPIIATICKLLECTMHGIPWLCTNVLLLVYGVKHQWHYHTLETILAVLQG